MNRSEKANFVGDLQTMLNGGDFVAFISFIGASTLEFSTMRAKARENGVAVKVVKNTLARLAISNVGVSNGASCISEIADKLSGPLVMACSSDKVSLAKMFSGLCGGKFKAFIGATNGELYDEAGMTYLASLPSLNESLAKITGLLAGVCGGIMMCISSVNSVGSVDSSPDNVSDSSLES